MSAPSPPAAAAPVRPVPKELPDVLARVNNEDVKRADFERLLRNIELTNNAPVPAERRDEIFRRVLDELVTYTLLKQETKGRNVTVTDAEVDEQLNSMRKAAGSEENFTKALAARQMTLERLKADTRVELAIARMMSDLVAAAAVTGAEAKEHYDQNPAKFKREETVRASHILVMVDPQADAATKQAAKNKIDEVLKRAKAGQDFAALARETSQDASAPRGGDLGFFPRQKMVAPFADAAFALKIGEMSDVVTTQFGYHIIKVTDRKPASTASLEEVGPQLKRMLTEQKKQQQAQAFIAQLKQKAKIEVLI